MIDSTIKQKLLNEISKLGNVYLSCLKIGVDKATYYRWKQNDKNFKKKADDAEMLGRGNIGDMAEYGLIQNIKKGDQRAIEFALSHNSEKYKQKKTSSVVIVHRKDIPTTDIPIKTLEDLIDEDDKRNNQEYECRQKDKIKNPNILITGIADSASLKDKPLEEPLENQKTSNTSDLNSPTQNKKRDNNT